MRTDLSTMSSKMTKKMKQRPVMKNRFASSSDKRERVSKVKQFTGTKMGAEKQERL
jgi:hypothetical protein